MDIREIAGKTYVIDGDQWYDENLNPLTRKSTTFKGTSFAVTFTQFEEYENYFGRCLILDITEESLTVRYIRADKAPVRDGLVATYPVAAQAKTVANAQRTEKAELDRTNTYDFTGTDSDFTLLWIAENGKIDVTCAPHSADNFRAYYQATVGHSADDHIGDGFNPNGHTDRWGNTLQVHIPMPDEDGLKGLTLPEDGVRVDGGTIIVSNNAYVRGLFRKGFEIGHNVENTKLQMAS